MYRKKKKYKDVISDVLPCKHSIYREEGRGHGENQARVGILLEEKEKVWELKRQNEEKWKRKKEQETMEKKQG